MKVIRLRLQVEVKRLKEDKVFENEEEEENGGGDMKVGGAISKERRDKVMSTKC